MHPVRKPLLHKWDLYLRSESSLFWGNGLCLPFALKEKGFEQREIEVLADVHMLTGKMRSNRGVGFSHLWLMSSHTLWLVGSHT